VTSWASVVAHLQHTAPEAALWCAWLLVSVVGGARVGRGLGR